MSETIKVCAECGDAYWEDVPCQTCIKKQVRQDAVLLGAGWMRVRADGVCERIAPENIYLKPDESDEKP